MEGMEIILNKNPASPNWRARLISDGELVESAQDIKPACAIRRVMNQYVFNHNDPPKTSVKIAITEWN